LVVLLLLAAAQSERPGRAPQPRSGAVRTDERARARSNVPLRVLFANRTDDVLTIDAIVADDVTDAWTGAQPSGCPVSMVVRLGASTPWVVDAAAAAVDRWAEDEAVVDATLKDGPEGPCLQLSGGSTTLRLDLVSEV
jgi:hypothetical protein